MKLSNLLSSIDLSLKTEDYQVTDIVSNGNNIKQNCIFVCIKGEHFDSHTLISEALNKGACAIICSEKTEIDNEKIYQVCDTRRALAILYFTFENVKTENLEFFAITGTNGKTTVTTIINHILKSFNLKTGLIGTIENCIGDDHSKAFATTPEPVMLAKLIKKMEENNCKTIVLEASSQALYQQRLASIKFKIAAFTNFSVDHLDYHKTMEEYFSAKKMLFEKCDIAVLNGDDKNVMTISEQETLSYKTFSIKNLNCDFFASEIGYYDNAVNFI
ncbi:MAG: Mur ligase family protein, partial [Oscillospiraceae bacterium]